MCLVEVEKAPKLAPACATSVMEGNVVHVHSPKARDARQGVLEMLLINHPLDCPICDQAGECELQDYTFQEGRADSRYQEPKRFNPVEDFGGDVLYVANRCILCTRCVRYMDTVADEAVLCVSERGDRAVISKFEGEDLTHAWAGNVVDLCPVGALLSKDFLNKARAWELDRAASVCPNCTQGCNSVLEVRDNTVVRMKPRSNDAVNQFYLCDPGRLDYRWLNRADRAEQPMVRSHGALAPVDWEAAIAQAASLLKGNAVHVLASPMLSNEALFLLGQLVKAQGGSGAFTVMTGPEAPLSGVPDLALRAERAANVRGAELLGFAKGGNPLAGLTTDKVLIVADHDVSHLDATALKAKAVIVIGTTLPTALSHADVVLPIANMAEEEGTFTNLRGRVQRYFQAKAAPGLARPAWFVLSDLVAAAGGAPARYAPGEVFGALAASHAHFAGMNWEGLGLSGALPAGGAA
ncbi:MAG: molybdopterin-dependent oxidoreductase [Gemmatimonadetes bacterium]|nr:molybdopterin-dependent oxidoreductase [Gemmatimonadota bacterium]